MLYMFYTRNMAQVGKKEIMKGVRLEGGIALLGEIAAGVTGKTFSELMRTLLQQYLGKQLPFVKSRVRELLDVFNKFEKSRDTDYVRQAEISKSLYPTGRSLDDYILFHKAQEAVEELKRRGFEGDFAETVAFKWFGWWTKSDEET